MTVILRRNNVKSIGFFDPNCNYNYLYYYMFISFFNLSEFIQFNYLEVI